MPLTYRPVLKSKSGEATALQHLSNAAKQRTTPLVVMVARPPATFADRIGDAWEGLPFALDGRFNADATGSTSAFKSMFETLGKAGVLVAPCVSQRADAAYLSAVNAAIGKYAGGLVVKSTLADLPAVTEWVHGQGWAVENVDLVVTFGDIASLPSDAFQKLSAQELTNHVNHDHGWRSVTATASSAPKDHGGLATGRNVIPRREWALWKHLSSAFGSELDYGDTGHVHPSLEEPPGYVMARATVSARYTVDDEWVILKGRSTQGQHGKPMPTQYQGHAKALFKESQFGGLTNCWGDQQIEAIAKGAPKAGNRTTWASISMNRHIELVADRLP
ncbi:MAG: beta family protein [Cucumibacter sp.]